MSAPRLRLPHPLVLLTGCVLLAAAASWVVPAGSFDRVENEQGRSEVVAGTYHEVDRAPVGPFAALVALPLGMIDSADIIFLVFLIGGAFTVVDESGTLRRAIGSLVRALRGRDLLVVPVISLFFGIGGVVQNMQEEIIPLIPVLMILTSRLGFRPLVAVAMSAGAAFVGAAFSPINLFQVVIAQGVADVPPMSGWAFRLVFLVLALALWTWATMRYAARTRFEPVVDPDAAVDGALTSSDGVVLAIVTATFVVMVTGLIRFGWGFNEMSAAFFAMGVAVGMISRMGVGGTAEAYVRGFQGMAYAALLIGFARAIYVVLVQGRIVDTLVFGIFTPLEDLPRLASALGMIVAQAAIHVPVPSVSSQAVLTMPVLVPVSDLLDISRQVTVLTYHYGAGLCDLVTWIR